MWRLRSPGLYSLSCLISASGSPLGAADRSPAGASGPGYAERSICIFTSLDGSTATSSSSFIFLEEEKMLR